MILTADWHLRRTTPRARVDNFFSSMEKKVRFILTLAQKSPPLLVAGDFFHHPKPGPFLEQWIINLLNEYKVKPIVVPGQHDLPSHSLARIQDSGLGVLCAAGAIELMLGESLGVCQSSSNYTIVGVPYGEFPPEDIKFGRDDKKRILLWHHMVINEKPLWPGQVADKATTILRKYGKLFNLIVTGDNHQTFTNVVKKKGMMPNCWLINPGSIMRTTISQFDHKPCVYKYESDKIEQILLPIDDDVFDLNEINTTKQKDERIMAFVDGLNDEWEASLSFEKNLEMFFQANSVKKEVKELIWKCLEA